MSEHEIIRETDSAPLAGLKVVDLTSFLSGPFATQVLADLGANVLKVEPPAGDSSRTVPPHFVNDDSAYYLGNNRSKRSIAIDLRQPEGQEIARNLIATADIVLENYTPGVASRLGLDAKELRKEHPSLIWASISGFGQAGPRSGLPAYDMIVQALSGVMSLTGEVGRPNVRLGIPAGDLVAGLYAVIGLLAALEKRRRTGLGAELDISMLDCQLAMTSYQSVYSLFSGETPQPQGARHDSIPTYRSFVGGDGREFVVTANTQRMFEELCQILGVPALTTDPRFVDASHRLEHREELWEILETAVSERPAEEWVTLLNEARVPAAMIRTIPEALEDAQEDRRNMVIDLHGESGESISVIGNPVQFVDEDTILPDPKYPPRLGEDTRDVLTSIGMSEIQIIRLIEEGIVKA